MAAGLIVIIVYLVGLTITRAILVYDETRLSLNPKKFDNPITWEIWPFLICWPITLFGMTGAYIFCWIADNKPNIHIGLIRKYSIWKPFDNWVMKNNKKIYEKHKLGE